MLSKTVFECQQKIANTLQKHFEGKVDPSTLENIICGVNQEVSLAYYLGGKDMLPDVKSCQS